MSVAQHKSSLKPDASMLALKTRLDKEGRVPKDDYERVCRLFWRGLPKQTRTYRDLFDQEVETEHEVAWDYDSLTQAVFGIHVVTIDGYVRTFKDLPEEMAISLATKKWRQAKTLEHSAVVEGALLTTRQEMLAKVELAETEQERNTILKFLKKTVGLG